MQRRSGGLRLAKLLLPCGLFREMLLELGQRQLFLLGADRFELLLLSGQRRGFVLAQLADV